MLDNFGHFKAAGATVLAAGGDDAHDVVALIEVDFLHGRICHQGVESSFVEVFVA